MPDAFHDFRTGSFGGVTCAQYWCDFFLWEMILNANPEIDGIVELGTWQGGFSRYLYAQAQARDYELFVTYDVADPQVPPPGFKKLDIYRHATEIADMLSGLKVPVALLCDGGNKPRELLAFPPYLPDGSLVVVHDWGTETMPADVPDFLTEVYGDFCDDIGSISRVFAVKP